MSNHTVVHRPKARISETKASAQPGRWVGLAILLALVLVSVAWFDGGEEPIRPIIQPVAAPIEQDVSDNDAQGQAPSVGAAN